MKKLIFISILCFLVSLPGHSGLSINYKKSKGKKSQTNYQYKNNGFDFSRNHNGQYRVKIGPFDHNSSKVRQPASYNRKFLQRVNRGSSRHSSYDKFRPNDTIFKNLQFKSKVVR
jgi:hypothetical protein